MALTITFPGPVGADILKYDYAPAEAPIPAVEIARLWIEEVLKEALWPDGSQPFLVHHGNGTGCDAVKLTYAREDLPDEVTLTIYQTLFVMVMVVKSAPSDDPDKTAAQIARFLFSQPERLNLVRVGTKPSGAVGRQVSRGMSYADADWLDTIRWWVTDDEVGFEMLKRTGPDQGTIVRHDIEGNRTWFALIK